MSKKSAKIAALIEQCRGKDLPAHYLGYFECFNRQLFYEAHDVLEELWLAEGKAGANYGFYKGLIQFAGAFVHLQKDRLRPAAALFRLSQTYLHRYPREHQRLSVAEIVARADEWTLDLERREFKSNPLHEKRPPQLTLHGAA
jgi:predicted metal-dependent hydrolase